MRYANIIPLLLLLCAGALVAPVAHADDPIADVILKSDAVIFLPRVEAQSFSLTVTSPCGVVITKRFDGRDTPVFSLEELQVDNVDGAYSYNLRMLPILSGAEKELLAALRKKGTKNDVARLRCDGKLFKEIPAQGGDFVVFQRAIVTDTGLPEPEEKPIPPRLSSPAGLSFPNSSGVDLAATGGLQSLPAADFVILDDLIVDGSACIGFDCVNGESFGFDTIRLKEHNLRIKFDDTSIAASYPRNDWQLTANDSANGGASKFSIDDISGGRTPFTVEANAPSHSLYVDDGGRIGSGTSTPSTEIHTVDGDTPTLRLQQDGSSGFAPQAWDVAGNETNFFIRDVTSGSTLPFRIRPGAPTSSIDISSDGDVGVGTASPDEKLHVLETANVNTLLVVENSNSGTNAAGVLRALSDTATVNFQAHGSGRTLTRFGETIAGWAELLQVSGNGLLIGTLGSDPLILGTNSNNVMEIAADGEIFHRGVSIHADYVFEEDYNLPTIEDNAEYMFANKHLQAIGPARYDAEGREIRAMGSDRQGIVEELEKAHIYIAQLNERLQQKTDPVEDLQRQNAELLERLQRLEALLTP